jgi:hypothetical protein
LDKSILTGSCTLVPLNFYRQDKAREILSEVVLLGDNEQVLSVEVPEYGAVMLYAAEDPRESRLPELYYVVKALSECREYNKIVASHKGGRLYLAIAQGRSLQLANSFEAPDFTTAQYYIFMALRSLQLNPEVSSICFTSPLKAEDEMSLYRYFKSVEVL